MYVKRIKNNYGFTLMETLVAAGVFAILGAITILFFIQCSNSWQLLTSQSDLRTIGRNDILYMVSELRRASNTSIPPAPNNNLITFYLPCDNTSNTSSGPCKVSPAIRTCTCNPDDPDCPLDCPHYPLVDANRNIQWDTANQIKYQIINNQLQRLVNGSLSHIISADASSVTFEDSSNPSLNINEIKITLALTRPTSANLSAYEFVILTGIVKLRNQQ
jgi:prepilin-type N-terminal cleavage/methylation domain-containing protein